MKTELVKIEDLIPADYNPRRMPEEEMQKLVRSLVHFGFVEPIVANKHPGRENVIVGGHQRVEAAKKLGHAEVPVVYVDLDEEKEKLLNLALNRISGEWDEEKLNALVAEISRTDSDILLSGFDSAEIDDILKDFREDGDEDFDLAKAIEEIGEPESKPGEVYELGPHRLMCGDSTSPEDVAKLMDGAEADMVFTDPPYNIGYESSGKNGKKWKQAYSDDDYSDDNFEEFCFKTFSNFKRHLRNGGAYYISSGWASWSAFWRTLCRIGLRPRGCIIWDKGHGGLGWSDYWYQQEMIAQGFNLDFKNESDEIFGIIAYGFDDSVKHYFAKRGGSRTSDVWRIARDPTHSYEHPTQKPVKLVENAVLNSSKIGGRVLDLFGGSGTTLMACERTGRKAYLMERSPLFVDVIRKRYAKHKNQ